jgi:hypothetical protein
LWIISGICPDVFHPPFPILSEEVEPQAVPFQIDLLDQDLPKRRPLRWIDQALEHRFLHTLAVI